VSLARLSPGENALIHGSTMGSAEDYRQMLRAVTVNQLRPVLDKVFPLEKAGEAMARMEAGSQFGKIALRISPQGRGREFTEHSGSGCI